MKNTSENLRLIEKNPHPGPPPEYRGRGQVSRREVVKMLGAGIVIAVGAPLVKAQTPPRRGGGGGGGFRGNSRPIPISARVHIAKDGVITVMTGKVECGQGARAELTQAAAEELRVAAAIVQLIMADTGLVPDDGMTAGSGTTPRTVPAVRQGAAAAREAMISLAAAQWKVQASECEARDGKVVHGPSTRELTYAQIAGDEEAAKAFGQNPPGNVSVTPVKQWRVLGVATPRPNGRDLVTGGHKYPSDIVRPNMAYGKVLRAPAYGAKLVSLDADAAKAIKDAVVVRDGDFAGVVAPTSWAAQQALAAIAKTAKWEGGSQASSATLYEDLRKHAQPHPNPFADELGKAAKTLKQTFTIAYVQHAPLEPRAAVAEWAEDGSKLTVWTGTQGPFGVRGQLEQAFGIGNGAIRVVVPDFGGGFGGKHSGECAIEAARLARGAKRPVSLRWTREEEFTWAYFRPAGVIEVEAGLDDKGTINSWHFINILSGGSAVETPYRIGKHQSRSVGSQSPLRTGSYRGLASTANVFARECAMDELAALAGSDPLEFRRAHLSEDDRLRAVLEAAAKKFGWSERAARKEPNIGVGLACGTEKGSYVAMCAQIAIDPKDGGVALRHVVAAYECGKILNPANLLSQVQGAIVMGIGPALREQIAFEAGRVQTDKFSAYPVPRFADVPAKIEVELVDRPDLPSAGAGETPIVGIAPAVANAVFAATGKRVREMPMRVPT
jgi:isoquinoline 1-oxidoreductase